MYPVVRSTSVPIAERLFLLRMRSPSQLIGYHSEDEIMSAVKSLRQIEPD